MAKAKTEACMLCLPDPCECFAPKKPTARQKRPVVAVIPTQETPVEVAPQPPRQDLRAMMKAAAANAPVVGIKPVQVQANRRAVPTQDNLLGELQPAARPVISDEQVLLNAALRALAPIMHDEEREHYRMLLGSSPTYDERRVEWRARRQCLQ